MKTLIPFLLVCTLYATDYHAAPFGLSTCDGSTTCPWDLQTALNRPLIGGDRLLLQDGTYQGRFTSTLTGNGTQIEVTAEPGAHPRIDGGLALNGGWVTVSYLEFFSSNTNRTLAGGDCIDTYGPNTNLIHNWIHDCGSSGIGFWSSNANGVAYGNAIYYVGYNGPDRGHGHGIYLQSNPGDTKLISDNAVLNNFGWGLHAYTEGGRIDNISFVGNTVSMNGSLATQGLTMNLLIGGLQIANNPVMRENVGYFPANKTNSNAYLGYGGSGTTSAVVTGNWFLGGTPLVLAGSNPGAQITGNWLMGTMQQAPTRGKSKPGGSCLPGNTCGTPPLTVLVRPDAYEAGRALVTVLALDGRTSQVAVPLAGYAEGQLAYVVSAEDPLGPRRAFPVSAGRITLPLTGWSVAAPVGWAKPASTLPRFGAFVVRSN